MEAKLVVVGGKANKSEVQLKLPTVIGRGGDADLTVAHPTVSRHHCVLFEQDGVLFVRDNGSLNGTLIDGNKVQESELKPGETLTVGPLTFRADYQLAGQLPSAPHTPASVHLAETTGSTPGSSGAPLEETIQFDEGAVVGTPAASGSDDSPSFGFLSEEPAGEARANSPLADSPLDSSPLDLGPPASIDDDVINFLDEKPGLPPTDIKIEDDGKPGKAAAQPAGDDELDDFFQSIGVK